MYLSLKNTLLLINANHHLSLQQVIIFLLVKVLPRGLWLLIVTEVWLKERLCHFFFFFFLTTLHGL